MRIITLLVFLFAALQGKPLIVASAYPIYNFVSAVAEEEVSLSLLVLPNNDPHSFEPTPKDIVNIGNADIFFFISPEFEPWTQKFVKRAKFAVSVSNEEHENHTHIEDCEHNDPHIWLDPEGAIEIIEIVAENLKKILPEKADFFEKNAENLISQINNMHSEYKIKFENCRLKKVFFAGHNSFAGFAQRYDLEFIPVTRSFSSSAEPSAKQIAEIIDNIKKNGAEFVYYDALSSVSIAKTIAKETKTRILPLYSIHTVSKDDFMKNIGYMEYMKRNYENLLQGLRFNR
jgi:zinc transport system substrate-binding protein